MLNELLYGISVGTIIGWLITRSKHDNFNPIVERKKDATYYKELDGTHFDVATKKEVFKRAGGKCQMCGVKMVFSDTDQSFWLFFLFRHKKPIFQCDHLINRDYGAPGELWNGVSACGPCNRRKSNKLTIAAYKLLVKRKETIYKPVISKELVEYLENKK